MNISEFPHHLFWSYAQGSDLPEEVVTEHVILYGDLEDLFLLSKLVSHKTIAEVNEKLERKKRWPKKIYFVNKIILGL
jgi:hypothetical protein